MIKIKLLMQQVAIIATIAKLLDQALPKNTTFVLIVAKGDNQEIECHSNLPAKIASAVSYEASRFYLEIVNKSN